MSELEVVVEGEIVQQLPLGELSSRANGEHHLAMEASTRSLMHAINCGGYLLAAKEQCAHGEFLPWLEQNFVASEREAQRYMFVFKRRGELANPTRVSDLSLRGALEQLREIDEEKRIPIPELVMPSEPLEMKPELASAINELVAEYGDLVTPERVTTLIGKRLARIKREQEAAARANDDEYVPEVEIGGCDIRCCDFRNLDLPDNSIDLIFTDPPYPAEYLPLWEDLSYFAALALKHDGILVSYSGQYHLPRVIESLSHHLDYLWSGTLVTPGKHNQVQQRKVRSAAKPILFFKKRDGGADLNWIDDAFISESKDSEDVIEANTLEDAFGKRPDFLRWRQSLGAAKYYIERLTSKGAVVVDPFLGSGTTAAASSELERTFIGCDLDKEAVRTAKKRLVI